MKNKMLRFVFLFTLVYIAINFSNKVYADYYKAVDWNRSNAGGQYLKSENDTQDMVYLKNLDMLKADGIVVNNNSMQINIFIDKFSNRFNILGPADALTKGNTCKIKVFDDIGELGECTFSMRAYIDDDTLYPQDQFIPFDYATGVNITFNRNVSGKIKFSFEYTWSGNCLGYDAYHEEWYTCPGLMTATTCTPLIELGEKNVYLDVKIISYLTDRVSYGSTQYLPKSSFQEPMYTCSTMSTNKAYILSPTGYLDLFSYDESTESMTVYELDNCGKTCRRKYTIKGYPGVKYKLFHVYYVPNSTDVLIAAGYKHNNNLHVYSILLKWDPNTLQYYTDENNVHSVCDTNQDEHFSAVSKNGFVIKNGFYTRIYYPKYDFTQYGSYHEIDEIEQDYYIGDHAFWWRNKNANPEMLNSDFYSWVSESDKEKWSPKQYSYDNLPVKEKTGVIAQLEIYHTDTRENECTDDITYFSNRSGEYIYVNSFGKAFYDRANIDRHIDDNGENISQYPMCSIVSPLQNEIIGGNTVFIPSINVYDANGNELTCKYYIDSILVDTDIRTVSNTKTTQLITFNNISALSEGEHIIKFEVSEAVCGAVTESIKFKIDESGPTISAIDFNNTTNTIGVSITATDSTVGLDANPYCYSIGTTQTPLWTSVNSHTFSSLLPNTPYKITVGVKDKVGNISSKEQLIYTKAQTPSISTITPGEEDLNITFSDLNPANTSYQIMFGNMYVDSDGSLTSTPKWVTKSGESLSVTGLLQNTSYQIKAKARNIENVETHFSREITGTTLAAPPSNITFTPTQTTMTIKWDAVPNALSYNLEDLENDGIAVKVTDSSYTYTGLTAETSHTFRISVNNAAGTGSWSNTYTKSTYPYPPVTPGDFKITEVSQKYINLSWDPVVKASEYILEANGKEVGTYTTTTAVHQNLTPNTQYKYRIKARNVGGDSAWSDYVTETTWPVIPEIPSNITARKTNVSADISWNSSERADGYEIEADRMIIDIGNKLEYLHKELTALSAHTYRVRAYNRGGKSEWSEVLEVTTNPDKPAVPNNIMATTDKNYTTLTWYLVPYAEKYDIEIDGKEVETAPDLSARINNLKPGTTHTYRVSARNVTGSSDWSEYVTVSTLPESDQVITSLTNVVAVVANSYITISWDDVDTNAEYLIEIDGVLQDIGKDRTYNHTGLSANQYHTYKVKAKTTTNQEYWCAVLSLSTLPDPPDAPTGVEASAYDNQIEIKWNKSDDVTYDIEVDGQTIDNGENSTYTHQKLNPGTEHTYRVRAKNATGVTAWSTAITKSTTLPEYTVKCSKNSTFDFSILASNVQDFTGLKFVITYNENDLDIEDLCSFTPKKETLQKEAIEGTKLSITREAGKIIITVKDNIVPGTSWSGELNNILFKSKIDGETKISVVVEN